MNIFAASTISTNYLWYHLCYGFIFFSLFHLILGDPYEVLGVSKFATESEIKIAYHKLAKEYHPDKNNDKDANEKFAEINKAYGQIGTPENREKYDAHGVDEHGNLREPSNFDFFAGFNRGSAIPKGPDVLIPLSVTLNELYTGIQLEFEMVRQTICHHCKGSGADHPKDVETCHRCKGRGIIVIQQMLMPGMYTQSQQQCDVCGGRGKLMKSKCRVCQGKKVENKKEVLKLKVPVGTPFGHRIKFRGKANESPDQQTGDLLVEVKLDDPKARFLRQGNHLYVTKQLGLQEALLGFKKTFSHLDGRNVTLERKGVTQPGFVHVIKNQGMPYYDNSRKRGHLFVKYEVIFPTQFSKNDLDELSKVLIAN